MLTLVLLSCIVVVVSLPLKMFAIVLASTIITCISVGECKGTNLWNWFRDSWDWGG